MNQTDLFNGKYIVKKELGGGSSEVYLVENVKLGNFWVLKKISKSGIGTTVEPEILKRLEHPLLPRIFDVEEDHDHICIIMEYIKGISLDKYIQKEGRADEKTVLKWGIQICGVLSYLHGIKPAPIIHRDLKPSNIILTDGGDLKLIDFGTAREYKDGNDSDTVYIGTKGYAAPEQYGGGQTSASSDIFSLGVTMHQLLTGINPNIPPFRPAPVREIDPDLSKNIENIIQKCTKTEPSERYSSVDELERELIYAAELQSGNSDPDNENHTSEGMAKAFKKLILTVWDNSEFACELAYTAARLSGYSILIADLDLLSPSVDLHLDVRRYPVNISASGLFNNTGLNIVLEAAEKNVLEGAVINKASVKRREASNLFVLTGCYKIEDYEYYSNESLNKFIECAYRNFDLTILVVNRSIYDSYTLVSLLHSDLNLCAVKPDIRNLRDYNSWISHLSKKQKIPTEKYKFVIFDWDPKNSWQEELAQKALGRSLIGKVRASEKRDHCRSLKVSYVRKMEKKGIADYRKILAQFHIIPKQSIPGKILDCMARIKIRRNITDKYPFIKNR
ncbi:MAG: serine/threonine-protein kinase [Eubacteriales bacterium]|nr:serine/threonine-protein kinase [Eubacteriales bacterium]